VLEVSNSGAKVSPDGAIAAQERFLWPKMLVMYAGPASDAALANYTIRGTDADGRFLKAAKDNAEVGTTGGTTSHDHGPGTLRFKYSKEHDHPLEVTEEVWAADPTDPTVMIRNDGTDDVNLTLDTHRHEFNVNPIHVGTLFDTEASGATGTTAASTWRPPWIAYYLIERNS
jgi:hypothetical protein